MYNERWKSRDAETRMAWTIIFTKPTALGLDPKRQVMCPNCAHRLFETNSKGAILTNQVDAEALLGGFIPAVTFKCPWCKSDFTLITPP